MPLAVFPQGARQHLPPRLVERKGRRKNREEKECSGKKKEEYEKIIHNQQQIIEKMNLQMKKQAMLIQKSRYLIFRYLFRNF